MTEAALISLAQIVLPSEVLSSFDITKVESTDTEINIHLDEKMYDTLLRTAIVATRTTDKLLPGMYSRH